MNQQQQERALEVLEAKLEELARMTVEEVLVTVKSCIDNADAAATEIGAPVDDIVTLARATLVAYRETGDEVVLRNAAGNLMVAAFKKVMDNMK